MPVCASCGFLALRNRFTGVLDEAPDEYRTNGQVPVLAKRLASNYSTSGNDFTEAPYRGEPICTMQSYRLIDEVEWRSGSIVPETVIRIMQTERDRCSAVFTDWQQGFTPKEHREMVDRKEQREWRAKQEEATKAWQERQRIQDRQWHIAEILLIIVATIIAAFIQRGVWALPSTPPVP